MSSTISAVITAMNDAGNVIRVGRARRDGWFTGAIPESAALTAVIWRADELKGGPGIDSLVARRTSRTHRDD